MSMMIGLEVHVQLNTKSKMFCSCSTDYRDAKPNSKTCPICLGFPGSKPKVNKKALDYGISIAHALNCQILPEMFFSRKSYLYPDMSKNFQITQFEIPLGRKGYLTINSNGQEKTINITRIHLEEDPAKLIHIGGDITTARYVHIDYNRSGIPLCEIVTEPDFRSSKEVRQFLTKLSAILEYLGVYDSSLEGSMRIDVNISIEGGKRVEIKNMSGFAKIEKALNYEVIRQRSILRNGGEVQRETRAFNEAQGITKTLRTKEMEEDYGYIFEPDLTKIEISDEWKNKIKKNLPELPDHLVERFQEKYGLSDYQAKVIVYTGKAFSEFFEDCCKLFDKHVTVAKWMITHLLKCLNYQSINIKQSKLSVEKFVKFLKMMDEEKVTERLGKEMIKEITLTGEDPEKYLKKKGLRMVSKQELEKIVKKVLEKNKKAVEDYRSGKEKSLEFLIGQVLREIKAAGDPNEIRKIIQALVAQ
ncbi:MAG: Asp-tRNA(Asn)/Glu-tRNA(Gln) amidotransferase subunit GatB [Candidatus Aenigmarchaeota archaeon]|nr:Asp-tRNA(Asn)/Glu-tRNA(Gln) amidotransferase subunit GatB [Candidatus Aenigmarchaeota archaeon]